MKIYVSLLKFYPLLTGFFLHLNITPSPVIADANSHQHILPNKIIFNLTSPDTGSLKKTLLDFIEKTDSGKSNEIIAYYDTGFVSVRVVDAGQFIKMNYSQMVFFWKTIEGKISASKPFNYKAIITKSTVIHYMEIIGNTGYVLMTRVKDFGNGPEPVFYNLIWVNKNNKWYLLREIVHQRTLPNFH